MLHLVIDILAVLHETTRKSIQRPDGQALWIDLSGHQPGNFTGLCIPPKLLKQFRIRLAKQALNDGTKARLARDPTW
jgi:hypothetical protein